MNGFRECGRWYADFDVPVDVAHAPRDAAIAVAPMAFRISRRFLCVFCVISPPRFRNMMSIDRRFVDPYDQATAGDDIETVLLETR